MNRQITDLLDLLQLYRQYWVTRDEVVCKKIIDVTVAIKMLKFQPGGTEANWLPFSITNRNLLHEVGTFMYDVDETAYKRILDTLAAS